MTDSEQASRSPAAGVRVLGVVCAATFFGVLNASAVTVVLPEIGAEFVVSPALLGWVMSLFLLTYGVAIPFYGRLADRFGARSLFIFGLGLFGAGSALCAIAPTFETVLGARVVQAVGGAAFPGLGMTLASRAFPPDRRGVALGTIAATLGVGAAVGPLAGGLVAELFSWRALFGISALTTAIVPMARRFLEPEKTDEGARVDVVGGALFGLGIAAALYGLAEGSRVGWTASTVLVSLAVMPAALGAMALHQSRTEEPFLPRELIGSGPYRRVLLMAFCTTSANLASLIGFPLLLTRFNGLSAFDIGLVLVPGSVMTAVVGVAAGRIVDRIGARMPTAVGAALMAAVMLGLSFWAGRSVWAVAVLAGLLGAAFSLLNTPLATAITAIVRPRVLASGLSLNTMVFFVGGSFGTTLFVLLAELGGAAGAWNPLYQGPSPGFSNAFLVFALPMLLATVLAIGLPAGRVADGLQLERA